MWQKSGSWVRGHAWVKPQQVNCHCETGLGKAVIAEYLAFGSRKVRSIRFDQRCLRATANFIYTSFLSSPEFPLSNTWTKLQKPGTFLSAQGNAMFLDVAVVGGSTMSLDAVVAAGCAMSLDAAGAPVTGLASLPTTNKIWHLYCKLPATTYWQ